MHTLIVKRQDLMQKMCIQVWGGVKNPENFAYVNT